MTRKKKSKRHLSKTQKIANHLRKYGSITSWQAIGKYGATRLSRSIHELRDRSWIIESKPVALKDNQGGKQKYVKYVLKSAPLENQLTMKLK